MTETQAKGFSRHEGYGAFTLGVSQKPRTIACIKRQAEHHRKRSFDGAFLVFLKKHAIEYDPTCVRGQAALSGQASPARKVPGCPECLVPQDALPTISLRRRFSPRLL
jgi:hypothetical protein